MFSFQMIQCSNRVPYKVMASFELAISTTYLFALYCKRNSLDDDRNKHLN